MTVQVIKRGNMPEWAVIPYETYLQLVEKAEMLQDVQDYDASRASLAHGNEMLVPSEVLHAILDGGNPIRIWREYRGLSQQALAENAGISISYLSQLESNERIAPPDVFIRTRHSARGPIRHLEPCINHH